MSGLRRWSHPSHIGAIERFRRNFALSDCPLSLETLLPELAPHDGGATGQDERDMANHVCNAGEGNFRYVGPCAGLHRHNPWPIVGSEEQTLLPRRAPTDDERTVRRWARQIREMGRLSGPIDPASLYPLEDEVPVSVPRAFSVLASTPYDERKLAAPNPRIHKAQGMFCWLFWQLFPAREPLNLDNVVLVLEFLIYHPTDRLTAHIANYFTTMVDHVHFYPNLPDVLAFTYWMRSMGFDVRALVGLETEDIILVLETPNDARLMRHVYWKQEMRTGKITGFRRSYLYIPPNVDYYVDPSGLGEEYSELELQGPNSRRPPSARTDDSEDLEEDMEELRADVEGTLGRFERQMREIQEILSSS